jgi:ComF family protein
MNGLFTLGQDLARGFLGLLYPEMCIACQAALAEHDRHFCANCRACLTTDPHATCPRCSSSVGPYTLLEHGCFQCRDDSFHFEAAIRMAPYGGLLREQILRMKNEAGEVLAELMGELFAETIQPRVLAWQPDAVVPVPLHWRRRWVRGFNQSALLAVAVARSLNVPCRSRWLRRSRYTPKQSQMSPAERRENVKGAFAARPRSELRGKSILLIDDVLTTGSTASEAAKALKQAGAGKVLVAVLAHGR